MYIFIFFVKYENGNLNYWFLYEEEYVWLEFYCGFKGYRKLDKILLMEYFFD